MKQKKQGHKMSHKIYAFIVILLGLAILLLGAFLLTYVQKIEVEGNEYTDSQEIVDLVEEDPFSLNSLYLLCKYRYMDYEMPGNFNSIQVTLTAPWSVRVTVSEKKILGYVAGAEENVYFDREGTVVRKAPDVMEGVPCIEGLDVSGAELYEPLENGDGKLFDSILAVTEDVKELELAPDRVVCSGEQIQLWFGEVCVLLGDDITTEKIAQIRPILEKLEGQSGTLHLEHFMEKGDAVTFDAGELP